MSSRREISDEEREELRRRGKKGGEKTRFLYGKKHFENIGKKGGRKMWGYRD